jgi:fructose-specific phosphotransferase system IIC component
LLSKFVVGLKKILSRLPQSLDGIKPVLLYPLLGVLLTSLIMMYIIINPVKALNDGLTGWPFAAADPARVIPACVIGSAIAGALTMLFKIGLPAPHGGVFVIPIVIGNPFLYALAILIGSIVTALIVGFLKPMKKENDIESEKAA